MKKSSLSVILGLLLGSMVVFAFAMDEAELAVRMKTVAKNMGAIKKGVDSGDLAAAGTAADTVAKAMTGTEEFWSAHHAEDAVTLTKESIAAANAVSAAAKEGNADKAKESFAKVGATCKGCHSKYREKDGDTYKVKLPH